MFGSPPAPTIVKVLPRRRGEFLPASCPRPAAPVVSSGRGREAEEGRPLSDPLRINRNGSQSQARKVQVISASARAGRGRVLPWGRGRLPLRMRAALQADYTGCGGHAVPWPLLRPGRRYKEAGKAAWQAAWRGVAQHE